MLRILFLSILCTSLASCLSSGAGNNPEPTNARPVDSASTPAAIVTPTPVAVPTPAPAAAKVYLDVRSLLGKPKAEFVRLYGTPKNTSGEWHDYSLPGAKLLATSHGLGVKFKGDRAVAMTIDLDAPAATPQAALARIGIDVGKAAPEVNIPAAVRWAGTFNGVKFTDLAAVNLGRGFGTVEVEIE